MPIMFLLGGLLSFFYRMANLGDPIYIFFYGLTFCMLLLSSFGETFITAASFWIQALAFVFVIHKIPFLLGYRTSVST